MPRPRGAIYRRCPSCQTVSQASAFRRAPIPFNAPGRLQRRTCPACGYVAVLMAFQIVARPESDQGESS
jgi:hypothetical protein